MQFTQCRNNRESRDPASLRVFRRDVFDVQGKPGRIGVNLDGMAVPLDPRVGPDVNQGAIRSYAGQRQRSRDIDIRWKTRSRGARGPTEYPLRLMPPLD